MRRLLLSMLMLGAAGLLKAQNPYPIMRIDSIQYVNPAKLANPTANTLPDYIDPVKQNPVYGDTVRFEGIVISNPKAYGLSTSRKGAYVQIKGGGPWRGVLVMCDKAIIGEAPFVDPNTGALYPDLQTFNNQTKFYDNAIVGYKCRFTGIIRNFQGETQINLIPNNPSWDNSVEQLSLTPDTLIYTDIQAKDLMSGNPNTGWVQQKLTAEQWEGTLVTIKNVSVYSLTNNIGGNVNRTAWSVIDDFGNVLDVRDFSSYYRRDGFGDSAGLNVVNTSRFICPPIGTRLEYIRGVVTEYSVGSVSRYGISPIYPSDIKVCTSCPPIIKFINRNPIIAKTSDTLNITFEITVGDTTLKTQYLYFRKPGTTTIDSVLMTAVPSFPNYYSGKVNPTGTEGVFTFWVRAEDKKNRQTFFPDPLTLGRDLYITTNGLTSIQTLQFSSRQGGASIWDKDSLLNIDVRGVVTGKNFGNMLTVQNGKGPNSAIFIQKGTNGTVDNWKVGDSVQITRATVGENFSTTNLYNILGTVLDSNKTLPAFETSLAIDSFILGRNAYARPYEGVLVRFDSVKVFSANPDGASDFGEFSILPKNSTSTLGLRIDDLSLNFKSWNKSVKAGMMMGFIQGPMYFANGNFKLIPRDSNDADFSRVDMVKPVIILNGLAIDTVKVGSGTYNDAGATATDNIDGNITANIVKTGTVNTAKVGTYTLVYNVSDAWGNKADSVLRTVIVRDTARVGINENEMNFAQLNVYPNPATTAITVSGNFIKTQPITITLVDLLGKEISTRTVRGTQFNETISIDNLNSGIYFCTISNASGSKTLKFVVNGK